MSKFSMKTAAVAAVIGGAIASAVSASAALNLPTQSCSYMFNTNMKLGSRGTDVMNLQKVLNMFPQTQVAATGAGSPGMETTYLGAGTRAAVNKFQALHLAELGITAPTGNVFAGTRGLLNQICTGGSMGSGTGSTGTTGTVTGPVSVMVASQQPTGMVVANQAAANLGNFVFSGNGMVNSVKLMRTGLSDDNTLRNVYLYDGMNRVAGPASVSRDGSVIFSSYSGLFAVSGMKTISVRGDVNNVNSQTIGFAVASIDTGAGATALLNVSGPQLTIGNVALAGVTISTAYPSGNPAATTLNAGSMAQNVWERQLSVSTREVKLSRAMFKMIGSAPFTAITNVKLNVDGANIANGSVDSNGYISFNLPTPYVLTTGSHIVKVFADVVGGANRTFYVSLEQLSDMMLEDSQIAGAYVTMTGTGAVSNMTGGVVTINTGNFTITQDTSISNITTLVGGATNQTLAKWKLTSYGEDVKVLSLGFTPTITGTGNNFANVGLYVNGGQVRSNQTATHATTLTYSDLGTNLIVPAGQTVTVELRGDLVTSGGTAFTTGTASFALNAGSNQAQGMSSQNLSNVPSASGQSYTIGSSNVAFALAAGSAAKTVSPNTASVKVGTYVLQTGSSEGVNVTSLTVALAGTLLSNNKITNLTVKDGSTIVGNVIGLPTASNNFSANISVPASTIKTFDIYADISSGAATYTVTPTVTVNYTGLSSRLSAATAATAGVQTTANVATIAGTDITFVPGSSPVAQYVVGGVTGLNIATFNVKVNNNVEGAVIKDMIFSVVGNTVSSLTVNGKAATVVGSTATVYDANITVPSNASGINVPVTVDLVCVGTAGCAGTSTTPTTVTLTSLTYNDGSAVSSAITPSPTAVTPTHRIVASKPTITMAQTTTGGFGNGAVKIGEFTVAADAAGDIAIKQIPVTISISGAGSITSTTTVELRDASGATVITGSSYTGSASAGNFVLSTSRKITKSTSETYSVYATFTGVSGNAGTQSVTFGLGAKASFLWDDVIGGTDRYVDGSLLHTYPNNTQSKTN